MLSIIVNSCGVGGNCYPVKLTTYSLVCLPISGELLEKLFFYCKFFTVTIYGLDRKVSAHLASLRIVRCGPFEPTSDIVAGTLQYFSMAARDRNL